jgi:hypothetical protein
MESAAKKQRVLARAGIGIRSYGASKAAWQQQT